LYTKEKAVVEEYLRDNVCLHFGGCLENYWTFVCTVYRFIFHLNPEILRLGWLKKATTAFDLNVAHLATDKAAFMWVERDILAVVLALLKNYSDLSKNICGKTYSIVNENISFGELADLTGNGVDSFVEDCTMLM
jgi:hypothetical protein